MRERGGVRSEIQALRTVAVLSVVLYHLWPNRLPGGFVGVDVFFAISGFLITAHLLREVADTGGIDVVRFWARRVRRLLPASFLVLLTTALAVLLVVPRSLWSQFLEAVIAAVLYAENWLLARQSVDYLAADNVATPVQHFWSLGVEEQFYVAWPLVILIVLTVIGRSRSRRLVRTTIAVVLGVVFIASLTASGVVTATSPSLAYFGTHIRAWEFAAGGVLAAIAPEPLSLTNRGRTILSWLGWAGIGVTLIVFTGATPFPSVTALLPVLSTLAVIAAGTPRGTWSTGPLMEFGAIRVLGDWSYSMYLWHWPMIVIVPYALHHPLGTRSKVAIIVAAVVLAGLSKRFVEDPARHSPLARTRTRRTFVVAAIAMVVTAALPIAGIQYTDRAQARSIVSASEAAAAESDCFGAAAMVHADCARPPAAEVLPEPAAVFDDTDEAFACYRPEGQPGLHKCSFGSDAPGARRVALVGDSHGAMLVPGLRDRMTALKWHLDVYVGWGGAWRSPETAPAGPDRSYLTALDAAIESGHYDTVLVTAHRDATNALSTDGSVEAGMRKVWASAVSRGTTVIAIRDNPQITTDALDCVTNGSTATGTFAGCSVPASQGLGGTDTVSAAASASGIPVVDTARYFCADDKCPVVIGGVVVYRDEHHLTATFSKTLAPFLINAVQTIQRQ